jgi:hypothetical protein
MADQGTQTTQGEKPPRRWQAIAREVDQEQDVKKMLELTAELNQALLEEERRKVQRRLGR